jgi:pheromone shutdown protein TraB
MLTLAVPVLAATTEARTVPSQVASGAVTSCDDDDDFDTLRHDVSVWTGWWKNRVARTLLVFLFTTFGTLLGEYIAGFRILKSLF